VGVGIGAGVAVGIGVGVGADVAVGTGCAVQPHSVKRATTIRAAATLLLTRTITSNLYNNNSSLTKSELPCSCPEDFYWHAFHTILSLLIRDLLAQNEIISFTSVTLPL
jgi:hypothetical protein